MSNSFAFEMQALEQEVVAALENSGIVPETISGGKVLPLPLAKESVHPAQRSITSDELEALFDEPDENGYSNRDMNVREYLKWSRKLIRMKAASAWLGEQSGIDDNIRAALITASDNEIRKYWACMEIEYDFLLINPQKSIDAARSIIMTNSLDDVDLASANRLIIELSGNCAG